MVFTIVLLALCIVVVGALYIVALVEMERLSKEGRARPQTRG
jgi:hypothetical protein